MEGESSKPRKRRRRICTKCGQELSHAAYNRHKNSAVCPGESEAIQAKSNQTAQASTSLETDIIYEESSERSDSLEESSETSDSSEESEDDIILSDNEEIVDFETNQDSDKYTGVGMASTSTEQQNLINKLILHICLFLSFFQLCYRVSERGITLLLSFLKSLVTWLTLFNSEQKNFKLLAEKMPSNVYFLQKLISGENSFKLYVSCPKCHTIYNFEDCFITRSGHKESKRCSYVEFPNHPQIRRRIQCGAMLLRSVKHGSSFKLIPRKVYPYVSIKKSLLKLFNQKHFQQQCEHWRSHSSIPGVFTDVYDGTVWKNFQVVDGRPFLQVPNNLCLKLNLDWFNPFDHAMYSVGVLYLVVENLPRSERYKLENVIIVGMIPGPKEPKNNINSYLKPLVDELLDLWKGTILKSISLFGITPVRCALSCISCDLPATRKICGFKSFSSLHGCSKCFKQFSCDHFGTKPDYSSYNRDEWSPRTHSEHIEQVREVIAAKIPTKRDEVEKKYGVRYSEILRLPYFNIVDYHVIDPMHNLLLGTAKHIIRLWKDLGIINNDSLSTIQDKVNELKVPPKLGRIPHKIASNFNSLTADQWKNWILVYSQYTLHGILTGAHYSCWSLFVDACRLILQPSISIHDLNHADSKLLEFVTAFELLYGTEHTTPNMHLHLHIKDCVLNYGPVHSFWCFPFERFNGILGSFQKNWVAPELQMLKKILSYQHFLRSGVDSSLPVEFKQVLYLQLSQNSNRSVSEGSVNETNIDTTQSVLDYTRNTMGSISSINALDVPIVKPAQKRYNKFFNHEEILWLTDVYQALYPDVVIGHVPMQHERFYGLTIQNKTFLSENARGSHSSIISAYWSFNEQFMLTDKLSFGQVLYFFRHSISFNSKTESHIFARINWFRPHPRENWFNSNIVVVDPDYVNSGPIVFMPVSRIFHQCALVSDKIKFDYGCDHVNIVIILSINTFCHQ